MPLDRCETGLLLLRKNQQSMTIHHPLYFEDSVELDIAVDFQNSYGNEHQPELADQ